MRPAHDDAEEATRALWDRLADDWLVQVGDAGDRNRRFISDPVLWRLAGDVRGKRVLDAGSGTGYLAKRLAGAGARVVGVDVSPRMVDIARARYPGLDFRVDSVSTLHTLEDASFDLVVSNYVLMDAPDLEGAAGAMARVLAAGGAAVLVLSHPCFPQGAAMRRGGDVVGYEWDVPYFERARREDPPWAHFKEPFVWFHRPLAHYWKAFTGAGLRVEDLEEPHLTLEQAATIDDARFRRNATTRPYSIAFRLRKPDAP